MAKMKWQIETVSPASSYYGYAWLPSAGNDGRPAIEITTDVYPSRQAALRALAKEASGRGYYPLDASLANTWNDTGKADARAIREYQ